MGSNGWDGGQGAPWGASRETPIQMDPGRCGDGPEPQTTLENPGIQPPHRAGENPGIQAPSVPML